MAFEKSKLVISDDLRDVMEDRGITEDDICQTILYGEGPAGKVVDSDNPAHCLAKMRVNKTTFYAEYTDTGDAIVINDVYSHRVSLGEDEQ